MKKKRTKKRLPPLAVLAFSAFLTMTAADTVDVKPASAVTLPTIKALYNGQSLPGDIGAYDRGIVVNGDTHVVWFILRSLGVDYEYKGNGLFVINGRAVQGVVYNGDTYLPWNQILPGQIEAKPVDGGWNFVLNPTVNSAPTIRALFNGQPLQGDRGTYDRGIVVNGHTHVAWFILRSLGVNYQYQGNGLFVINGRPVQGVVYNGDTYLRWDQILPGNIQAQPVTGGWNFTLKNDNNNTTTPTTDSMPTIRALYNGQPLQNSGKSYDRGIVVNGDTHIVWTILNSLGVNYQYKGNGLFVINERQVQGVVYKGDTYLPWNQILPDGRLQAQGIDGGWNFVLANPYEVLDLRKPAPITASDIDNFLRQNKPDSPLIGLGNVFIKAQNDYGVNAQYLVAHAIHESAWGLSDLAKYKNNLFGYMAYDSDPFGSAAAFASYQDAILYEAYFVATQYLSPQGAWFEGSNLIGMNVHYATDPLWSQKVAYFMRQMRPYNANDYAGKPIMSVTGPKPQGPLPPVINETLAITYPSGALGVTTDTVNFREKPSTSATIYRQLNAGTQLTVIGKNSGGWYQVKVGEQSGWISGDYIKLLNVLQVVNADPALNVRKEPVIGNNVDTTVPNGTYLIAKLEASNNPITVPDKDPSKKWYQIVFNGQDRYVYGDFIQRVQ